MKSAGTAAMLDYRVPQFDLWQTGSDLKDQRMFRMFECQFVKLVRFGR